MVVLKKILDASILSWFEEITPSMDSYSVLVIADGDGWDAGEYTIMASYGKKNQMCTVQ